MTINQSSKRYDRNLQLFEQMYQARVTPDGYAHTRQMVSANWYEQGVLFDDAVSVYKEPMVCVKMPESCLHEVCGILADREKHDQLQARYPQLREAYVNYLSMLHLTADLEDLS
jgi:hypothetical protein